MITPDEIKKQVVKWWKPFLQSHLQEQKFFPKTIDRIRKIQPSQVLANLNSLQDQVSDLYNYSKSQLGYGYVVRTRHKNFRRTGSHELPETIEFETAEDFIFYTGKKKEWQQFLKNLSLIQDSVPPLKNWAIENAEQLATNKNWNEVLKVCQYFIKNPRPELYIRQLPIEVHTKFIEDNEPLLRSLLDFLLPEHIRCIEEKSFAKRYYLKHDEPLIRLRILDSDLAIQKLTDITIKLSDFQTIDLGCRNVLLTENKMNFLALPKAYKTVAIWSGGGFNISYLKGIAWLLNVNIFYWGDLDIQGFHILHQLRSYFRQARSIMMDRITYDEFQLYKGDGKSGNIGNIHLLTKEERQMFEFLKKDNLRLEQEKILQSYAEEVIRRTIVSEPNKSISSN